ncbi:MAG TPA: hypothetical protein VE913_08555, partial [Longimicrobium sp.]|nr:hypothetical protein [Longimicrobium sp.]
MTKNRVPPLDPISPARWRALLRLVSVLESARIEYQLSGGLAGNVHGSAWPLHDIDVDVPGARIAEVASLFPGEVGHGPARFVDDEFELTLLRLELNGVPVDVSSADNAWVFTRAAVRTPLRIDLARAERREFRGIVLPVVPLDDLIAYKQLIGRDRDVADLL